MRRGSALAILFAVAGLSACQALLGVEEVTLRDEDTGASPGDSAATAEVAPDSATVTDSPCDTAGDDPNHCGACGHSCGGGGCAAGVCQALVLAKATTGTQIYGLAVDTNASGVVFFSQTDGKTARVERVEKTGAPASRRIIWSLATALTPTRMTYIGDRLVSVLTDDITLARDGKLLAMKSDGTEWNDKGAWDRPFRIVHDESQVYWLNDGDLDVVLRASPILGGVEAMYGYEGDAGTFRDRVFALAVQDGVSGWIFVSTATGVLRVSKNAPDLGPVTSFSAVALAASNERLFAATRTELRSVPIGGCPPATPGCPAVLAKGRELVDVVHDKGVVYYADRFDGTVHAVNADGTGARVLATGQTDLHVLATDSLSVYWASPTAVGKVAK